jgi:hypothetical protein
MLTIPWTSPKHQPQTATLVQISRLELARKRDVPGFLIAALRIRRIALRTPGAGGLSLRAQPLRHGLEPRPHGRLALPYLDRCR